MLMLYTVSFRDHNGTELHKKCWERNFEIPLIVHNLKVHFNGFDDVVLSDVHYNPKTHQYWAEHLFVETIDWEYQDKLDSCIRMHDEQMANGGWTERT